MKSTIKQIINVALLAFFSIQAARAQISDEQLYKLTQVLNNVDRYYTDSIDDNKIIEDVIVSTLKELDPHSTYFGKEEAADINRSLEGSFEGIGISYDIIHDTIMVLSVIGGGPAEQAGLKPGDKILKADEANLAGVEVTEKIIREKFSGSRGSRIALTVKRNKQRKPIVFQITRDRISVSSIEAAYMADQNTGYIKLSRFSANSAEDFKKELEKLIDSGAENLILDLRDNGGGYLNAAVDIADNFLKKNKMIVYTEGLKSPRKNYFATSDGIFHDGKVVVMIDEGTASASEILAGALQDWDRGVIVGRRSFGKGLVQRPFNLVDGSMMRLTVARYYTPGGRCIQKPYDQGYSAYNRELGQRSEHGELVNSDSIKQNKELEYKTLVNGRSIFGGGGIMPDIFIPADTAAYPPFYQNWLKTDGFNAFIHEYVDNNREFFQTIYSDFDKFRSNFKIEDKFYTKLLAALDTSKTISITQLKEKPSIALHLKALVAQDLWNAQAFWKTLNPSNEAFRRALETVNSEERFKFVLAENGN